MAKNKDEDGDVECPYCGVGMKFLKRKISTKDWPDEDGYSDHQCLNEDCEEFETKHRLFDNGDCEER